MNLLKLIALSMFALGAAYPAALTHHSTGATSFTPIALSLAPNTPFFDSAPGTLTQVLFELDGTIEGDSPFLTPRNTGGPTSSWASSELNPVDSVGLHTVIGPIHPAALELK